MALAPGRGQPALPPVSEHAGRVAQGASADLMESNDSEEGYLIYTLRAGDGAVQAADVIVPVPLHPLRLLWRKFNQSAELAREIGVLAAKPVLTNAVRRTKRTRRQVGLAPRAREDNVRGAFAVTPAGREALFGRRVVLVDDVYTTGATVAAVTRTLKQAGVLDVTVLTFARALPGPI